MTDKVIAISKFQGNINWAEAKKDGVIKACSRLGEGATYVDPMFLTNFKQSRVAGINTGAWHIFRTRTSTPQQQAASIVKMLKEADFSDENFLAFEVYNGRGQNSESTKEEMSDNLYKLIEIVLESGLPVSFNNLYIKTNIDTWKNSVAWELHKEFFGELNLWTEHWRTTPDHPETLLPWGEGKWKLWEYSPRGKVKGISGDVLISKRNCICQ